MTFSVRTCSENHVLPLGPGNEAWMPGFFLPHAESPSAGGESGSEEGRTQRLGRGWEHLVCLIPIPIFIFSSVKTYLGFVFIGKDKIRMKMICQEGSLYTRIPKIGTHGTSHKVIWGKTRVGQEARRARGSVAWSLCWGFHRKERTRQNRYIE